MVPSSMGRKRSRSRRHWLRRGLLLAALLLLAGAVGLDPLAKVLLERRATDALGLPVVVKSVAVGLFREHSVIHGLTIQNPEGFSASPFFEMERLELPISLWRLAKKPLDLESVLATGVTLSYEQTPSASNVGRVLQILDERRAVRGEGRRYRIQRLDLSRVQFQARFEPWPTDRPLARVGVDALTLTEIGTDTNTGVLLGEIAGILVSAVLGSSMKKGAKELPGEVWGVLESPLKALLRAPSRSVRIFEGLAPKDLGGVLNQLGDVLGGRK